MLGFLRTEKHKAQAYALLGSRKQFVKQGLSSVKQFRSLEDPDRYNTS